MAYTLFNRILPGIWKQEYWPYVVTAQCLTLCVRRCAVATEAGDFASAQKELESASQLLEAANQSIRVASLPAQKEGMTSLVKKHPYPPLIREMVLPNVPVTNWHSRHHTQNVPLPFEQHFNELQGHEHEGRLASERESYPSLIRLSGKTLSYLLLAILGAFLAGCLGLIVGPMESVVPIMETALEIFWRWILIAVALFVSGVIIASLKVE